MLFVVFGIVSGAVIVVLLTLFCCALLVLRRSAAARNRPRKSLKPADSVDAAGRRQNASNSTAVTPALCRQSTDTPSTRDRRDWDTEYSNMINVRIYHGSKLTKRRV